MYLYVQILISLISHTRKCGDWGPLLLLEVWRKENEIEGKSHGNGIYYGAKTKIL
jgi:hypothetical protein